MSLDNFFGSTNIVAQLSFSMLSSIVTFEFDLVLGLFLTFWGFFVVEFGSKTISRCTRVVKHLLFSKFSSIPTFDFDLILGSFFTFGALMGLFWGRGRVQKLFWGLLI